MNDLNNAFIISAPVIYVIVAVLWNAVNHWKISSQSREQAELQQSITKQLDRIKEPRMEEASGFQQASPVGLDWNAGAAAYGGPHGGSPFNLTANFPYYYITRRGLDQLLVNQQALAKLRNQEKLKMKSIQDIQELSRASEQLAVHLSDKSFFVKVSIDAGNDDAALVVHVKITAETVARVVSEVPHTWSGHKVALRAVDVTAIEEAAERASANLERDQIRKVLKGIDERTGVMHEQLVKVKDKVQYLFDCEQSRDCDERNRSEEEGQRETPVVELSDNQLYARCARYALYLAIVLTVCLNGKDIIKAIREPAAPPIQKPQPVQVERPDPPPVVIVNPKPE